MSKFTTRLEGPLHIVYDAESGVTIKECDTAREAAIYEATEKAGDVGKLGEHLLKKYGDAHLFTDCMGDESTAEYDHETRAAVCARAHHEATGKWPTEKELKEAGDALDEVEVNENWVDSILKEFQDDDQRRAVFANLADSGGGSGGGHRMVHVSGIKKAIDEVKFQRAARDRGGYSGDTHGDTRTIARNYKHAVSRLRSLVDKYQEDGYSGGKGALKKAGLKEGNEMDETTEKASTEAGDYLIVEDREKPTTWHLQVRKNGKPDHGLMGSAWAALHTGFRGNVYEGPNKQEAIGKLRKLYESEDMPVPGEEKKEHDPSFLARVVSLFTSDKEGRRHSSTDQDAIQQIHDLSTKAGADCPMMVVKQANGAARWVLISSNAYEDRDGEYVSLKAQKRDVKRMKETGQYGPLRWWHVGYPDAEKKEAGPGIDIGDCDYSEMFDKFNVESGTFRNERVAAAIKERADQLGGSKGFFHPQDDPDPSGKFREIYTFERSLLPRAKASNYLTPLAAILKEQQDMATKEEKIKGLVDLLGDEKLAQQVVGQVDKMEKEAQARGLTFKQQDDPAAPAVAAKGDKKDGDGEPDEDDFSDMDEATKKSYDVMLPHIVKAIHTMTKKTNIEGKKERKATKKERKQLTADLEAIKASIAELKGELPRGLAGGAYRPSQTGENLITLAGVPTLKENIPDPLGDFMVNMGMAKFDPTQPGGNGQGR